MRHVPQADARRGPGRKRLAGLTGAVLGLALLSATAVVGQHTHATGLESPLACAVCATAHHAPTPAAPVVLLAFAVPTIGIPLAVASVEAPVRIDVRRPTSRAPPIA